MNNELPKNPKSELSPEHLTRGVSTLSFPTMSKISPDSAVSIDANTKNFLCSDVVLQGEIHTVSNLVFDGSLTGKISGAVELIVGKNARIDGEISAQSVTVYGQVTGNVMATEKIILKDGSEIHGDLISKRLSMEEGAVFVGSSKISAK